MAGNKKKRDKQKPRKPKVDLMAGMPRPKPIQWNRPSQSLEQARELPFLGSWVMSGWKEQGLTPVVVARLQEGDRVTFGSFIVDHYCLGVKNALWKSDISLKQFNKNLPMLCSNMPEPCEVSFAHELIYGSIEFARKYGFEPHRDFETASLVLDLPGEQPKEHKLEFGKDGKPFFISGPYDNARLIINTLMRTAGEGNFDYLLMMDGPGF